MKQDRRQYKYKALATESESFCMRIVTGRDSCLANPIHSGAYYLGYAPNRARSLRPAAFEDWIVNEAQNVQDG